MGQTVMLNIHIPGQFFLVSQFAKTVQCLNLPAYFLHHQKSYMFFNWLLTLSREKDFLKKKIPGGVRTQSMLSAEEPTWVSFILTQGKAIS